MVLSSIVVSDFCLRWLRRNHVMKNSWLVNAARNVRQSLDFLTCYVRQTPETLNLCSVICAAGCLSRLCIDLTCKSLALSASLASGVNAPLECNYCCIESVCRAAYKLLMIIESYFCIWKSSVDCISDPWFSFICKFPYSNNIPQFF